MALVREGTASISTLSLMTNDGDASVADLAKTATYRLTRAVRRPLRAVSTVSAGDDQRGGEVPPGSWLSELAPTTDSRREQAGRNG